MPIQHVSKGDVDDVLTWLVTSGGKNGGGVAPASANASLSRFTCALGDAVKQGLLLRNPAALVDPIHAEPRAKTVWTSEQASAFLDQHRSHPLYCAFVLSLLGMRRGEVLGLRWTSVDLDAGTLAVVENAVLVGTQVVVGSPKTRTSRRVLPLAPDGVATLRAERARQAAARLALGPIWTDSGLVVVNEAGSRSSRMPTRIGSSARRGMPGCHPSGCTTCAGSQ